MPDSLIVPLFVTTDLPPRADLAEFGELLARAARVLGAGDGHEATLTGKVFWLDRPVLPEQRPAAEGELRFAGMLGHLTVSGAGHTVRDVVSGVRLAIGAAVTEHYGDVGVVPAVFAIRDRDVRERTPDAAFSVEVREAAAELVSAAPPAGR
ncbi:hypothetical protein DMB42_16470 [Nonomuraea sp. WAC 01424]|uniref:hypothetical protein n=1 Tax=Nonomuraea sp. WAC 01424 TaxID=2203200 RepID=UPI000F78CBDC|nr:hypothetical protein [Nonomuraea sp. WAC 01424]RSN10497.1 hypothetical protein DMB42_16470 [Nonomuraea sp. WAC 01424]